MEALQSKSSYPYPHAKEIKTQCRRPIKDTAKEPLEPPPIEVEEFIKDISDGRRHFKKTDEWPQSVHGVLSVYINNIRSWGTGILIGPNIVLTAGHNLYDFKEKAYADLDKMQFLPGVNGQKLPFGHVKVKKYFISPKYIKDKKEDYGILILTETIGKKTGYFGLACLKPEELESKRISIFGYPSDKVESTSKTYELWGETSTVSYIDSDEGFIDYFIDTASGQSGSGVYYEEAENFYVCGVHIQGSRLVNRGTLLTNDIYEQIYTWLQEFDGLEFTLAKRPNFFNSEIDQKDVI